MRKNKNAKEFKPSRTRLFIEELFTKARIIPIPIWIILSTIFNYLLGSNIAKINELYSNVAKYDSKSSFTKTLLGLVLIWLVVKIANQVVGKVEKSILLNKNYMKWITKLTTSKLSSISSISTGAANNAIHTIAGCDKDMVEYALAIIPNIMPFVMLCIKEYKAGGMIPVLINLVCMTIYIVWSTIASNSQSYGRQAQSRSELSTVTMDCIKNSQSIKYFNKENWSIRRQKDAQDASFGRELAIPIVVANSIAYTIMWLPTIAAVWFCWEDTGTVLYVVMMSYVIDNIGCYISHFMDKYTEKRNQLEILGGLEPDENIKKKLPDVLRLKDVVFKYDKNNKDAVEFRIDELEIKKGHRYCVTGKSGFGKSTLAKLLSGTFKPMSGVIPEVDSVYMFAESEMFNTTIAENITLGDASDNKEITDMLQALEVSVDLDVFKDSVGESGHLLSTGQKQRINLARTLFYARRHPDALIVMDEVTAALDIKTSITCLEYLTSEFKRLGVTLIYISNKTDYLEVDLITDNIYVNRTDKTVTYSAD